MVCVCYWRENTSYTLWAARLYSMYGVGERRVKGFYVRIKEKGNGEEEREGRECVCVCAFIREREREREREMKI